jgi:uncharacterized protein YbgA (DUF1722 family)/uncharacterized protein YbbK (DUF523 family)
MSPTKPKIAISACLLGDEVRFNGGHKRSELCVERLSEHVEFVGACPEVAIGLGTPREAIRLVGDIAAPRAVGSVHREQDFTDALHNYGKHMAEHLQGISGYIFMQKSPSCGLYRVKVYGPNGLPEAGGGRGLYAAAFCAEHPNLPVEEEGRLNDPVLRENFLTRVFAYADWHDLLTQGLTCQRLTHFHARYKYLLLATHPEQYRILGKLLGGLDKHNLDDIAPRYFSALMVALQKCATRGTHSNVLQHISGYLKQTLSSDEKIEMQQLIEQYRRGYVPLVVPLTLLKHHFLLHPDRYIAQQVYLQPHPANLSLRNAL